MPPHTQFESVWPWLTDEEAQELVIDENDSNSNIDGCDSGGGGGGKRRIHVLNLNKVRAVAKRLGYEEWYYCNVYNESETAAFQKINYVSAADSDNATDEAESIVKIQFYPRTGAANLCIFEPDNEAKPIIMEETTEDGTVVQHDGRALLRSPEFYNNLGIVSPPQDEFDNMPLDTLFNGCSKKSLYTVPRISCLET